MFILGHIGITLGIAFIFWSVLQVLQFVGCFSTGLVIGHVTTDGESGRVPSFG